MILPLLFLIDAAAAQPARKGPVEELHQKVVDAIRNCGRSAGDEIVVCARDRGVAEGYRIPKLDPRFAKGELRPSGRGTEAASSAIGAAGTGACSRSGAGGFTGCSVKDYRSWRAERDRDLAEARAATEGPK